MTSRTDESAEASVTGDAGGTSVSTGTADPIDFETAERQLLAETGVDARTRFVEPDGPIGRLHVVETGSPDDGPPVLFVHGTGVFGALFAPLLAAVESGRLLAFDRPGYGRSDPFTYAPGTHRDVGVDATAALLDELEVETVDLVGHSFGGYVAIAFALAHPDRVRRLLLLGSVPTFPGTRPPLPIRLMVAPVVGRLVRALQRSGEAGAIDFAGIFGERETVQRYPAMVRAMAAHQRDSRRAAVGRGELRTVATLRGWRPGARVGEDHVGAISRPTAFVLGDHDPLGGLEDVRSAVDVLPDARLEVVEGGHVPFFGHPERCAQVLADVRG